MPLKIIKTADEWADLNRALGGYKKFIETLRQNASKEVNQVLDDIETRVDDGEDFEELLKEYAGNKPFFSSWLKERAPDEYKKTKEDEGFTKGQELTGKDSDGNKVSGTYIRSIFGRPQIETSFGPVVLSEVM